MKSRFKRTINWKKNQTKVSTERQNQHLDFLINPSFQGLNRLFVLSLENKGDRKVLTGYNLSNVEKRITTLWLMEKTFFDQTVKSNMRTYDDIGKITTGQGDDYTTGCLLDYDYFKKYYKMKAIDLSKQQTLDADPKAIQQINFTGNLEQDNSAIMFFIIEEAKKTVSYFLQVTVKVLQFYFALI